MPFKNTRKFTSVPAKTSTVTRTSSSDSNWGARREPHSLIIHSLIVVGWQIFTAAYFEDDASVGLGERTALFLRFRRACPGSERTSDGYRQRTTFPQDLRLGLAPAESANPSLLTVSNRSRWVNKNIGLNGGPKKIYHVYNK